MGRAISNRRFGKFGNPTINHKIAFSFAYRCMIILWTLKQRPWLLCHAIRITMMTSSNGNISALLALCAGNSPVTGAFPSQRPVTRSFGVFFDLCLNKRLSKQSWGWWFEMSSRSSWCQHNDHAWEVPVSIMAYCQGISFSHKQKNLTPSFVLAFKSIVHLHTISFVFDFKSNEHSFSHCLLSLLCVVQTLAFCHSFPLLRVMDNLSPSRVPVERLMISDAIALIMTSL